MGADSRIMEFFRSIYDRAEAESIAADLRDRIERDGYGWWSSR